MKKRLNGSMFLKIVLFSGILISYSNAAYSVAQDTLAKLIMSDQPDEFLIIELRGPQEITKVIGNENCKPYNLVWPDTFKAHCEKIRKDQRIFLNCASGNRAGQAKTYLEGLGYQYVYNVGGFSSWQSKYPNLTIEYKDTLSIAYLPASSKKLPMQTFCKTSHRIGVSPKDELQISISNPNKHLSNNIVYLLSGQLICKSNNKQKANGTVCIVRLKNDELKTQK
jgi:rhodanese-related sulfurtransferase